MKSLLSSRANVIGIDPGPIHSALTEIDQSGAVVQYVDQAANEVVLGMVAQLEGHVAVEWPRFMGKDDAVLVETAAWAGRFYQRALDFRRPAATFPYHSVRTHFGLSRATEQELRYHVLARYGEVKVIPFSKRHAWAALAVALVYLDQVINAPAPAGIQGGQSNGER